MTQEREKSALDVPFVVPYTHRLRFTDDVLGDDQGVLDDVLQGTGGMPVRLQFWLDQHVADARPNLVSQLREFADTRPHLERVSNIQFVPGGEEIKNDIHILERMLKVFNVANLDRRSYVIVVGGGAVLDAVGFAAAIAHRGIRLIRLPTTTLGQADSGLGVKNGVNLFQKKNWLGSFAVPWAVINDASMLQSLSDRDFRGGFSEAVKVTLLKDRQGFERICASAEDIRQRQQHATGPVIRQSAELHLQHITRGGDPFEMLEARPLDFGHWSAHKMEAMSDFSLRHGEAVAIGVAVDTVYSAMAMGFPMTQAKRVLHCLAQLGFNLDDPTLHDTAILFDGLEEFRQHLGGRLTLTMLRDVADPVEVHEVDRPKMEKAIHYVAQFAQEVAAEVANPDHLSGNQKG